jgi:versiconal hemiacetal acetate esterase
VAEFGETPNLFGTLDDTKQQYGRMMGKLMSMYEFPAPDETVKTETISVGEISVRTYAPDGATGNEPVGVYFHGGGFVMGSVEQEDGLCRLLSRHGRMTIVSVEYRLAPEFPFPTAVSDSVSATKWALARYGCDSVILLGSSAGANLAFAAALSLIDDGLPEKVKGVVSLAPITVHPDAVPHDKRGQYTAYDENDKFTVNSKAAMLAWLDAYNAPAADPYLSVLLHPKLKQLQKVYIAGFGADTLRDDAQLMKEALEESGVPIMYDTYPGYPHYSGIFPSKCLDGHRKEFFGGVFKGIGWMTQK